MIFKIAWKNIGRNKRRSLIVISAVLIGTVMGVFATSIVYGMFELKVKDTIYLEEGSLQIHHKDYLDNPELNLIVDSVKQIEDYLSTYSHPITVSKRICVNAMASTARANGGLSLIGVSNNSSFESEHLPHYMVKDAGTFLDPSQRYPIVVSDRTADLLSLKRYVYHKDSCDIPAEVQTKLQSIEGKRYREKQDFKKALQAHLSKEAFDMYGFDLLKRSESYRLHGKIIMTFTNTSGELVSHYFRICGIYKSFNAMYDSQYAYVLNRDLQTILEWDVPKYQEIVVLLPKDYHAPDVAKKMQKDFPYLSVLSWKELSPLTSLISDVLSYYSAIIMGFILCALLFGIINTMLMAILERKKELKMLIAIGMQPHRVFRMIVVETVVLTLVGALVGMLLAAVLIGITSKTGIYFGSVAEGFESMGFASFVYPTLPLIEYFKVTGFVIIAGVLASLYPAYNALKK